MDEKLQNTGIDTALVLIGWISFATSFFVEGALTMLVLQAVARVLPPALDRPLGREEP